MALWGYSYRRSLRSVAPFCMVPLICSIALSLVQSLAHAAGTTSPRGAKERREASQSQTSPSSRIGLGLQLGLNVSGFAEGPANTSSRLGLMMGAMAELKIADFLYLQPEFMFVEKGAIEHAGNLEITYRFNYLTLPVFLKFKYDRAPLKPYFLLGPDLGVRVNKDAVLSDNLTATTLRVINNISPFDFAFDFGLGAEYDITASASVYGTFRYSMGLSDIDEDKVNHLKMNGYQVLGGIKFSL